MSKILEFRGKNYEFIQFLENSSKGILFLSVDSLFKKYFKKGKSIVLEKDKEYRISEIVETAQTHFQNCF